MVHGELRDVTSLEVSNMATLTFETIGDTFDALSHDFDFSTKWPSVESVTVATRAARLFYQREGFILPYPCLLSMT